MTRHVFIVQKLKSLNLMNIVMYTVEEIIRIFIVLRRENGKIAT